LGNSQNGRTPRFRIARARSRFVGSMTALVLVVTGLVAVDVPAANAVEIPKASVGKSVPGASANALRAPSSPKSSKSLRPKGSAAPKSGDYEASLVTGDAESKLVARVPRTKGTAVSVQGAWVDLGTSGLSIAAAGADVPTGDNTVTAAKVHVLSPAEAKVLGIDGLALSVERTDGQTGKASLAIRVPNSVLSNLYGADYASRVQWTQSAGDGTDAIAVPLAQDTATNSLVLAPSVTSSATILAATAGAVSSSGAGDFSATSLSPAAAVNVSAQTGGLSWSYPMRTPPAAAGPSPSLSVEYSSQAVDGETGSTNNQPSVVGEGWSLSAGGFIERSYTSCSKDGQSASGDQCWKVDNATVSFAGHSGHLVLKSTSSAKDVWRFQEDDGSLIEHLYGTAQGCKANATYDTDCWRITTTDGTQYWFGLNTLPGTGTVVTTKSTFTVPVYGNNTGEPCHASTFSASSCVQAWRWNLDWIVDVHGVAQALYYNAETNKYAKNGSTTTATTYTRGGSLNHIDYGLSATAPYATNAASDRVVFGYDTKGRCSATTGCTTESVNGSATAPANASLYPDIPFDQLCTGSSCSGKTSPTFWTTARLATVTTQNLVGTTYSPVDVWTFTHSFPDPGDGTSAALWLAQIDHASGSTPSLTEPATIFTGTTLQNRVWATDGLAPLDKYRISAIRTASGALTSVQYSEQECTPAEATYIEAHANTNTKRCFPQWWTPSVTPAQTPQLDLFHKYVVTSVVTDPQTGGARDLPQETTYNYTGTPAWRYEDSPFVPDNRKTWSVWAGYDTVEVNVGPISDPTQQQVTKYVFFQGMDQDRADTAGALRTAYVSGSTTFKDSLWFAGRTRSKTVYSGAGSGEVETTETTFTPWASSITASLSTPYESRFVADSTVVTTEPLSTGGTWTSTSDATYDDATGLPTQKSVVTSDHAGDDCTTTSYAAGTNKIVGLISEVLDLSVPCSAAATAVYPDDVISHSRIYYDGLTTLGAAPTKGDQTKTQTAKSYSGTTAATANWLTASIQTFDALGRVLTVMDVSGNSITKAYTPTGVAAAAGGLTKLVVTNQAPFNWTTTTNFDTAWGQVTSMVDQNAKTATAEYDGLGRRIKVWYGDHPKVSYPTSPSVTYAYNLSATTTTSVATSVLAPSNLITTYDLYDGLGRLVQTQGPAEATGTVVTDTEYDRSGQVAASNSAYWTTSVTPSGTLFVPTSLSTIPSRTVSTFDGGGRVLSTKLVSLGVDKFHTDYAYPGADRTDFTPPSGGTPQSTFVNSSGQTTKLVQYLDNSVSSTADHENTTYEYDNRGNLVHVTAPDGSQWTWAYNLLGQQLTSTDPDKGTVTTTYDDASNPLTVTDARGVVLAYKYDVLKRPIELYEDSADSSGTKLESWVYDTLAKGQLTSSTRYIGSTPGTDGLAYSNSVTGYDGGYRPTGSTVSIPVGAPAFGGTTYTTSSTYNTDGTLATTSYPAVGGLPAETLRRYYTATGLPGLLSGTKTYGTALYSAIGQLSQLSRSSTAGLTSTYNYDQGTGALNRIQQTQSFGGANSTPSDRTYAYDDAGNVTSIQTASSTLATDTQCFSYDYLRNLTEAWTPSSNDCADAASSTTLGGPAPYWNQYTVSTASGNRLGAVINPTTASGDTTTDTYSYPSGSSNPHAVQSVSRDVSGTVTERDFTYDAAGNTIGRDGQTLAYDELGKLSSLTDGSRTQSNVYTASGSLLLQVDSTSGATLFLGDTELHRATGSSVSTATRTYSLAGAPVAERSTDTAGVNTYNWLGTDAQGTAQVEVDTATGATTVRNQDPFGIARGGAAVWSSTHGFLNASVSDFTGLVQLGARLYDSTIGRFLTVDPVLDTSSPAQMNGYSYASNSPITMSDASGELAGCASTYIAELGCQASNKANAAKKAGSGGGGASTASAGSGSVAKAPPKPKQVDWWNPTTWDADAWQTAAAIGAGFVAGVAVVGVVVAATGCVVATFGVCGAVLLGAGIAAGAAGAAVTYGVQPGEKSAEGLGEAVLWGAATGAVGGVVAPVVGKVLSVVAPKLVSAAGNAVNKLFGASKAASSSATVDTAATRASLRVGTKAEIRANAKTNADGDFLDPNTGAVIPKEGPFDYGHVPGKEWWRTQKTAREEGWSRQQVIEHENNPSHYQIEDPSSNRSHAFEQVR
jgi:RHS repeat-associated protein